jgi:hypothetical protein
VLRNSTPSKRQTGDSYPGQPLSRAPEQVR